MPRFSSARLRRLVQFCFVLFLAWTVWRLYGYAQWMAGYGGFVPRPPAAEAPSSGSNASSSRAGTIPSIPPG